MSEQITRLDYAKPFGKVLIETPKFREKFYIPPALLLLALDDRFTDVSLDDAKPIIPDSELYVGSYERTAKYVQGQTVYEPKLTIARLLDDDPEQMEIIASIGGTNVGNQGFYSYDLNPASKEQCRYILEGRTRWPETAVPERIASHDRLLTAGEQLIQLVASTNPDRNFGDYKARKIVGA